MEDHQKIRAGAAALLALVLLAFAARPAAAAGDLAVKSTILEPLVLGAGENDYAMSVKEYELETGRSYRLKIEAAGFKEYAFAAPGFFRNTWIRKVAVGEVEIETPVIDGLGLEHEGEAEIFFVPIRPGTFEFKILGLEDKGMVGRFVVK